MNKVSVIIPTYNRARYLKECIDSVLNQGFMNLEIIVCDNASTDNTTQIINSFNDKRIFYYRNNTNLGATKNYNKVLSYVTGDFIQIFGDDDVMNIGCIQKKLEIFNSYPTVGLIHTDLNIINEKSEITSADHWAKNAWGKWSTTHSESRFFSNAEYHKILYRIRNIISMATVMIRREVFEKVGYFNSNLDYIIDWDYWLRITLFYDVYYLNEKLISQRLHASNEQKSMTQLIHKNEEKIMYTDLKSKYPDNIIYTNNNYHNLIRNSGYYTDYKIHRPFKYLLKRIIIALTNDKFLGEKR